MTPWPNYEVVYYLDVKGNCPVKDFLNRLPERVQGKVFKWIRFMNDFLIRSKGGEVEL